MKRWDPAIAYLGSGEYAPDMEECASGEYVRHADHTEALLAALRREKAALDAAEKQWLEPASPPAHEVVDVPPEPWHARLVRLAQVAQDTSKACAEAEAAFKVADAERERTRLVRAAAREACHAARKALTAATTARAIIDAQQPASVQPTRPEPRYKVGDWVRVVTGPNSAGRTTPIRVTCVTSAGYIMADGASWAAENLTPALDPALHETARTAARMLLCGKWPLGLPRVRELPGFDAWNLGPLKSSEWAAQLERLLGDAP